MTKLVSIVSKALGLTFVKGIANKAGITFKTNTYNGVNSISVFSDKYINVYARISGDMKSEAMKKISNNMFQMETIGKHIKSAIYNLKHEPYGNWFVTENTVKTATIKGDKYYSCTFYLDGRAPMVTLLSKEPKKALPRLKTTTKKKAEAVKAPEFDYVRFNKYIDLVANFRPTYTELTKLKTIKIDTSRLDLDNPLQILTALVHIARLYSERTYKSSNEDEARKIIAKVNKIKEERKEAAKAASTPQFDRDRFNKYVQLVADYRKYYKVNAEKLLTAKLNEKAQQLNLNIPEQILYAIIDVVRELNGKEYKASIESEVDAIINKVNKIKANK